MTKWWPFCLAFNVLMHYGWCEACSRCWLPRLHALYTWVSTRIQYLQYITSGDMTVLCRASFRIHWPMCNQLCLMAGRLLLHQSRSSIKQYFNFVAYFFVPTWTTLLMLIYMYVLSNYIFTLINIKYLHLESCTLCLLLGWLVKCGVTSELYPWWFAVKTVIFFINIKTIGLWKEVLIDLSHKSHNAPVPDPTMHHFVTEMCTCVHISVTKWCIAGYLSGALWDLHDGSILTHW